MRTALDDLLLEPNLRLATHPDPSAADHEHFVQFYESDAFLLDSLSASLGAALKAGSAGVVIATETHREELAARLTARGLDVALLSSRGQYTALDAADTLARLMVDGAPDPRRFSEVIGPVLAQASTSGRRVVAFGEMVALLWLAGEPAAALRVEELWNDLRKTHSFALICGYPMHGFAEEDDHGSFTEVCRQHSRVLPAESFAALQTSDERLREISLLQQKAQLLEAEITTRKETEAALKRHEQEIERLLASTQAAHRDAEAANRAKDVFLATLSHELRTPLNAILGWAVLLRRYRHCESKEVSEGLGAIERSARAQAKLIEDVLDISRIVSGKFPLEPRPCELVSMIGAAIDAVRPAADARSIELTIDLDPEASFVQGDAVRLQQVFWNLLSNAVKFTPKHGRIEVRLTRQASAARVTIKDSGRGISADFLPHVFDRFRQADDGTTRLHGGLGLGLSIVRHIVEMHGGTVAAESAGSNLGATFTVELPIRAVRDTEPRRAGDAAAGAEALGQVLVGLRVLVVDDEEDALTLLRRTLESAGAEVSVANSAAEAIELLREMTPNVLVSDIGMPFEDGYTLIRRIRTGGQGAKELPAVALTAFASTADKQKALLSGFQVHVAKPVDPDELTAVVASLAGRTGT